MLTMNIVIEVLGPLYFALTIVGAYLVLKELNKPKTK